MPSVHHSGDNDLRGAALGGIGQACVSPINDEYRALVDAIGDWVWEIDEHGIITYASPRAKSVIGYEPEELIGKQYMNCLPEREKPHIAKLFQTASAARQPQSPIEHFELSKQGYEIPVETAIVSIIEGDGVLRGYRGITREIAVRKRVERDRDFSAAILDSVSQVSPDGFLLVDPQGNVLSYNRRFLDIWNISAELAAGNPDAPLLRLVSTKVSNKEEFLARIKALYANAVETAHEEVSLKDGRTLERYTTPIRLKNGTYLGRVWFFRDISAAKRVEAKTREDEAQFRVLVEQEVAGIYMISGDGTVAYLNSRFSEMMGYAVAEVIGHPFLEFIAEPDREDVTRQFALLVSGKQATIKLQLALKHKDGQFVDMLTHGSLAIHNGQPTAIGVAIDITEHKRFEKTLRASEERFRLLVEQAPEAILVYDADRESFVQANKVAEELFGCDRADLLKLGPLHFYCPVQPGGRPADVTFAENVARALKGEVVKFERCICASDGRESYCQVTLVGLPSAEGGLLRASFTDVTERRNTERKIVESEARLQTLMETVTDGIVMVDAVTHAFALTNRALCNMLGYNKDELALLTMEDIHPPEAIDEVKNGFERQLKGDWAGAQDVPVKRKDGTLLFADINGKPVVLGGRTYMVATIHDITERRASERTMARLNVTLKTLSQANATLVHATTEAELLNAMCRIVVDVGGYSLAWIGSVDEGGGKSVKPIAWSGPEVSYLEGLEVDWSDGERGQGPTGVAIKMNATKIDRDFSTNPDLGPWRQEALKRNLASAAAFPLHDKERVFGSLTIYSVNADAFDAQEIALLEELASDLSYGILALRDRIGREAAVKRLQKSLIETVTALANMVEIRDAYTAGHQRRVSTLASAMARLMGLPEEKIEGVLLAGVIHDVGKIQVPAEILSKPGKLSPLEFELVKCHAQAGFDIVKGIDFPWPIARIIQQHHERLDGSGYPDGLSGDAILLEAKILAVADVVEAMMSHRPYRPALGLEAALAEIQTGRGLRYDAAVVDACVKLFKEKNFVLT